jgi:hypothetical protein
MAGLSNGVNCRLKNLKSIQGDINLMQFVIPGLTKPAPYLIRGNPVFFWIPAGVYPVLDTGRE